MPKTIVVIVAPNGETTVQTHGYSGTECLEASRILEQELGLTIREQKSAEYFTTRSQTQIATQQ